MCICCSTIDLLALPSDWRFSGEDFCLDEGSGVVIPSGYKFVIGWLVLPVDVLMLAALIRPSSPEMVSSTTASHQFMRGVSS